LTVQQHQLANGFRIVTETMPGLQSAAIGVWVTAGGRNERIEQNGIAHFLEHMAFKGTKRRSALEIAEAIEDVGGYINAYTSREHTCFHARVVDTHLEEAMDILSDIVLSPRPSVDDLARETDVVLQEIAMVEEDPEDCLMEAFWREIWPQSSLGHSILGMPETVRGFNLSGLECWRTATRQGTLADLIWDIYRETGYYDFVGGLPGGGQRQANLRSLHHRARQYEATAFRGLFLFLRFIERVRDGGRDLGAARALSEKENVVRIMSVHKSKGLEFPVVFVAGLGKKFNVKDLNKTVLFHKDLVLGPQLVDAEARITYPTVAKLALRQRLKREALAEEIRILYVALTRAREKLILVGSARNLPECARRWCGSVGMGDWALPDGELAGARTYLDWLIPAVARHKDGVEIRKLGLCEDHPPEIVAADSSSWKVFFPESRARVGAGKETDTELFSKIRRMESLDPSGPLAEIIKTRLEWSYPAAGMLGRAAKASVTDLKRKFDLLAAGEEQWQRDFRPPIGGRPLFMQEERGLTAVEVGSALHLVMQHLDLKNALDTSAIREFVADMVVRELLTHEQAEAVPVEQITAFFAGPLGGRVLAGREVLRELPFTLAVPAGEIYPDLGESFTERVVVQGVVDCLVDEEDGYLLLDYKTDRIPRGQLEQAAGRYRGQLNLYAKAVESILGRKVKEKHLYLFNLGLSIQCD